VETAVPFLVPKTYDKAEISNDWEIPSP